VQLGETSERGGLATEAMLGCPEQDFADLLLREITQRSNAATGLCRWFWSRRIIEQSGEIKPDLWNESMIGRAREEFRSCAALDEHVQDDALVYGVRAVPVPLPIAHVGIEFDAPANCLSAIDRDRCLSEIGTGLVIPDSGWTTSIRRPSLLVNSRPNSPANQRACSSCSLIRRGTRRRWSSWSADSISAAYRSPGLTIFQRSGAFPPASTVISASTTLRTSAPD
jgi:hypothetical protein